VQRKFPSALLPLLVATVEQFETVAECVLIQRYEGPPQPPAKSPLVKSSNQRYKWLCFIELSKAVLRLGQLYKSDRFSCMLLDGGTSGVGKAIPFDKSLNKADRQRVESFQTFRTKYLAFHPTSSMGANSTQKDVDLDVPRSLMPLAMNMGGGDLTLDLSLQGRRQVLEALGFHLGGRGGLFGHHQQGHRKGALLEGQSLDAKRIPVQVGKASPIHGSVSLLRQIHKEKPHESTGLAQANSTAWNGNRRWLQPDG
jgi:hypothetical protein